MAVASAGKTCPAVPPPATTTFIVARLSPRPRRCGGRSRATLARTPIPTNVTTNAVPPNETRGSGTPVIGNKPGHRAQVDDRLQADPADDPGGEEPLERVRACIAIRTPA